jgi:hypothetical protein
MSMSLTFNTFGVVNSDAARRTAAVGQIRPWCSTGTDDSLPLDSVRAGRMPTTEGVGHNRNLGEQEFEQIGARLVGPSARRPLAAR